MRNRLRNIRGSASMLAAVMLILPAAGFLAFEPNNATVYVVQVEEDWELIVGEPDTNTCSPQVATQMFPYSNRSDLFAIFAINFQEIGTFVEGGLEIQLWEGDWNVDVKSDNQPKFSHVDEVMVWTQFLKINGVNLKFGLKNGSSTTFGTLDTLFFNVQTASTHSNLDDYSAAKSVASSGITLGSNRVKLLRIKEVRKTYSDGTVETDSTPRIVFQRVSE